MDKQRAALQGRAKIILKQVDGVQHMYNICENVVCDLMREAIKLDNPSTVKYLLDNSVGVRCVVDEINGKSAVGKERLEIVKILVEGGANKDEVIFDGDFIIILDIMKEDTRMLEYLIDIGMNVNIKNNALFTPLQGACSSGNAKAVECLLRNGADVNLFSKKTDSPLFIAIEKGHIDIVCLLTKYDADILCEDKRGRTVFCAVFCHKKYTCTDLFNYRDESESTRKNKTEILSILIERKCVKDLLSEKSRNIILFMAVFQGDLDKLKILIDNGIDVKEFEKEDSILSGARLIGRGNIDRFKIYDLLIKEGANINSGTRTPLHNAIVDRDDILVKYLLGVGADMSDNRFPPRERNQRSPSIYTAIKKGFFNVVEILLNNGADANFYRHGNYLIDLTVNDVNNRHGVEEHDIVEHGIVELLLKHGADTSHMKIEYPSVVKAKNNLKKRKFSATDSNMFTIKDKEIARTVFSLGKKETLFKRLPEDIMREVCTHAFQFQSN